MFEKEIQEKIGIEYTVIAEDEHSEVFFPSLMKVLADVTSVFQIDDDTACKLIRASTLENTLHMERHGYYVWCEPKFGIQA